MPHFQKVCDWGKKEMIGTLILLIIFTLAYLVRALKKEIVLSTGITWIHLK